MWMFTSVPAAHVCHNEGTCHPLFIFYKFPHVICWQKEKCRVYLWPWNEPMLHFLISQNRKWWTCPSAFCPFFHWCFIVSCFSELSNVKHALSLVAYCDIIMKVTSWIPHLFIKKHYVILLYTIFPCVLDKMQHWCVEFVSLIGIFSALQQPWQGEEDSCWRGPCC